jgi:hypothetical protein
VENNQEEPTLKESNYPPVAQLRLRLPLVITSGDFRRPEAETQEEGAFHLCDPYQGRTRSFFPVPQVAPAATHGHRLRRCLEIGHL